MNIVIVGAGEVGFHLARHLSEEGKNITLIERDPARAKQVAAKLDIILINGEGTNMEILKQAGCASADVFIAATTSDEVNLISCFMVSSEFNIPTKIARVRNENYSKSQIFTAEEKGGLVYIINTDEAAVEEIIEIIQQGASSTLSVFDNANLQMREFVANYDSYFTLKAVKDLRIGLQENFVIAGIVRGEELTIPDGEFVIAENDMIYLVAERRSLRRLAGKIGFKTDSLRKIAVVGGTQIGLSVAEALAAKGRNVLLIDKDAVRCKQLAEVLSDVLVINGDISDATLYKEENIQDMDAIVCTTQNEELNIISGLYAKSIGIKRSVAVVEKTSYMELAGSIGIDSIVNPRYCAINAILKFIRKGNVSSIHSIFDGQAEAIEIRTTLNSPIINTPLKDLKLPPDCRMVAVMRGRHCLIPTGNLILRPKDRAVFFVKRSRIPQFEELIS